MTVFAQWLNTVFGGFDAAVATFANGLHTGEAGAFFDWFFPSVTVLGNEGLFFIVLGILFLLFRKTRKSGASILIALLFGLLMTNMFLKTLVARPRPYVDELSIFHDFWLAIGHGVESESGSFPSGHATSAFAAMFALFWSADKRYSWTGLILAALIGFSRIYIHVHYASDIIAGALVGFICGTLAFLLIRWVFGRLERIDTPAARFVTTASLGSLLHNNN